MLVKQSSVERRAELAACRVRPPPTHALFNLFLFPPGPRAHACDRAALTWTRAESGGVRGRCGKRGVTVCRNLNLVIGIFKFSDKHT